MGWFFDDAFHYICRSVWYFLAFALENTVVSRNTKVTLLFTKNNGYYIAALLLIWLFYIFGKSWRFILQCLYLFRNILPLQNMVSPGPCGISMIKPFSQIVNACSPLTIFAKNSIIYIWQSTKYVSFTVLQNVLSLNFWL